MYLKSSRLIDFLPPFSLDQLKGIALYMFERMDPTLHRHKVKEAMKWSIIPHYRKKIKEGNKSEGLFFSGVH